MTKKCIFLQKNLVISKKSSTFARFFDPRIIYELFGGAEKS